MSEDKKKYKILLIESSGDLRDSMAALLKKAGYEALVFSSSVEALKALQTVKASDYALIMSGYQMPEITGDELLMQAQELIPDALRLLVADANDIQMLISAINKAGIHACLTLPFEDEDFLNRIAHCCEQYDITIKKKNLKKITRRQNKQLFQIASNFKKENDKNIAQLTQKDKEIRVLESRIKSAGGNVEPEKSVSLRDILKTRQAAITQEGLGAEFLLITEQIKKILEAAGLTEFITLESLAYKKAINLPPPAKPEKEVALDVLERVNILLEKNQIPETADAKIQTDISTVVLDDHFELSFTENSTQALITVTSDTANTMSLAHVKQFLEKNKVINGVKRDHDIKSWLCTADPEDPPFIIAQGRDPKLPTDAEVRYHFPTDYLHAGKVNDDGSINFRDRGEIPYVEEETFLAAKIFAEPGTPGINVHGKEIEVEAPIDITFSPGPGTRMSEDGVRIYATASGQPHLDAMGNISVCPEYQLKGDIGYDTGDVSFDGNVIVNGTVKQGFKVQCASLTAKEIEGAEIDITGDLNVSLGIVDTKLVKVKGSVQAKFIRNSEINAFGDLIVQKEIIDSTIRLSGACINERGSIINSQISAKMGIQAGSIGNVSSRPSSLTVGVDEHVNLLVARVDSQLNLNNTTINEIKAEVAELEKEDQELHAVISQHAHVQDRSQLELNDIEKKMENLKASGNMSAYQKVSKTVAEIRKNAEKAEEKINEGFDRQDEIAIETSQKKNRMKEFVDMNKDLLDEKKRLLEFSDRKEPLPEVKVAKKVESGTKIFSENASLTLHNASSRCRIREFSKSPDGVGGILFYELKVGEY